MHAAVVNVSKKPIDLTSEYLDFPCGNVIPMYKERMSLIGEIFDKDKDIKELVINYETMALVFSRHENG